MQLLENLKFIYNYYLKIFRIIIKPKISFCSCPLNILQEHLKTSEGICQKLVTSLPEDLLIIRLLSEVNLVLLMHLVSFLFVKSQVQIKEIVFDIFLIMNDH